MAKMSPMLSLFKEQLVAECSDLVSRQGLKNQGQGLIWWYFIRLHNLCEVDIEGIACDGGMDLGIDAIWIDDEDVVHFYQFKNPVSIDKGWGAGEVDQFLAGLRVILSHDYKKIANVELKGRVEEIFQRVPSGYRLHLVSSAGGLPQESAVKLDAFVEEMSISSAPDFFRWSEESLNFLQDKFYQQKTPAVQEPIVFNLESQPYVVRAAMADSYFFHANGGILAGLYGHHGERLLQRNIRVNQGGTTTNRAIEATGSGPDSENFVHFNNGVTFLCDAASFDIVRRTLTLTRAQLVNGGQTIRTLHKLQKANKLKADVSVSVRVITSQGDKEFGNNVAVNQNNQNQMNTGFLRSNDPRIVQLAHALTSLGWYLERREGELAAASTAERAALEHLIRRPLEGRIITLKEGLQSYVSTFFEQPELARGCYEL